MPAFPSRQSDHRARSSHHPQGFNGWLALKSKRGEPAGAVHLQLRFADLAGEAHNATPGALSPLERHPQWKVLLSPSLLSPFPTPSTAPQGFEGQPARLNVIIESINIGAVWEDGEPGPGLTSCLCHASYRLPGSTAEHMTSAKPSVKRDASVGLSGWQVQMQHCGTHWVQANAQVARVLYGGVPLTVTVFKRVSCSRLYLRRHHPWHN